MADPVAPLPQPANGQFMGGNVNAPPVGVPYPQQYAIPPQGYPVQIQGTGGMPSPGAGLISGMQAGQQLAGNAVAASRSRTAYKQQQADRAASAKPSQTLSGAIPPDPSAQPMHPEVHNTIMQGVINGVKGLFGMGQPSAPSPGAGGAQPQPTPVPTQSQVPQQGPNAQGSPAAMQEGGPVTPARPLPFLARPAPGTTGIETSHQALPGISGYEQGGMVGYEDGGSVAPQAAPIPPIQGTGGMPSPGAGLVSGIAAGQSLADNAIGAARGRTAYEQQQADRAASAAPAKSLADHVEGLATALHGAALDDEGVPHGSQGISAPAAPGAAPGAAPSPVPGQPGQQQAVAAASQAAPEATAAAGAVQKAAADPNAQQGIPQKSPDESGKRAHSLTPEFWDKVNKQILDAASAAAMNGRDPNEVMHSLTAMRNSFFQGEVLKNLSAANQALIAGDNKAVEKALRNVYYYFPDGQDLQLHHGPNGELQYQDPITPVGKDGKPNFVDVTAEHLQLVGQAALDPMTVANTLQQYRAIPFNRQIQLMEAQAKLKSASGEEMRGHGIELGGQARVGEVASTNVKNLSAAQLDQAKAASSAYALKLIQGLKLDPTAQRAVQATNSLVDNLVLGPPRQVPDTDKDGGVNMSPAAGKVIHDPSRVPKEFQQISAMDLAQVHGWAAGLVAANPRGMTPQQAASIAAQAYQGAKGTHKDGSKTVHDVMVDRQTNTLHVWDKQAKQWRNYPMASGTAMPLGSVDPSIFQMATGGPGAIPTPGGSPNPVDDALNSGLAGGD